MFLVVCKYCSSRPKEDLEIVNVGVALKKIHAGNINQMSVVVRNKSSAWDFMGDKGIVCVYDKSNNVVDTSGEFTIDSGSERTFNFDMEMPNHDEQYRVVLVKSQWLKADKCEDYSIINVSLAEADEEEESGDGIDDAVDSIFDWIRDHQVEVAVATIIIIIIGLYIIKQR